MELIPSLDLLDGHVVRLRRGAFGSARVYGRPDDVLDELQLPGGTRLHVVDLEASRRGKPVESDAVRRLAERDLVVQVGGGVRAISDARRWFDCGARRVVVGTIAATDPRLLRSLVETFGPERILPAIDVRDGVIRVDGWTRATETSLRYVFGRLEELAIPEALVTDIESDGVLEGPAFTLYRELRALTTTRLIASGGVTTAGDAVSLSRIGNVSGCVIGRALLERRIDLKEARERLATAQSVPERVIPCLDVRDGRVVKGVAFQRLRDAGDPVECARRYEAAGADELVMLDVSASDRDSATALDTVRRVASSIFIPLTVGGGVRSVEDFRALLRAGADRVAVNTAAVRRPELIGECASEFGAQAVVLSCDAKGGRVAVRAGKEVTEIDAVEWCRSAEERGAGEILLTSVDRDGTSLGFDLPLLRSVTAAVRIGVIASGGAGCVEHFREAIECGARAVLAASLFHDGVLGVEDVKRHLRQERIPVR